MILKLRWSRLKRFKRLTLFCIGVFLFTVASFLRSPLVDVDLEEMKTQIIYEAINYIEDSFHLQNVSTYISQPSDSNMCKNNGSEHYLLFMFITSPENLSQRNVIRQIYKESVEEWETNILDKRTDYKSGESIKILFFVGLPNDENLKDNLMDEGECHGDIIMDDFKESYLKLTLKTVRMLKWVQTYCSKVRYLVKVDDDVYFNMPNLVTFLEKQSDEDGQYLIAGHKYQNTSLDTDPNSKWYAPLSMWVENGIFPDFVAGFFYILGTQARTSLYNTALQTPVFHLEDVFLTGIVRINTNDKLIMKNIPGIYRYWTNFNNIFSSCMLSELVAVHSLSTKRLYCWSQFSRNSFKCSAWPIITYCL